MHRHKTGEKLGHRRVTQTGVITYKKKPIQELIKAFQLGIEASIFSIEHKPKRDVLLKDFGETETLEFTKEDLDNIPGYTLGAFKFCNYAPNAFRFFREVYNVNAKDYLDSLCGQDLRDLPTAGRSGAVFYISANDKFIIKTIPHEEAVFIKKLLPEYFLNLTQHPRTLLPRFYGHYCYRNYGKNVRLMVMNNIIPSFIQIHEKYDLKGSTHRRFATAKEKQKKNPTLKDVDFKYLHPQGLFLDNDVYYSLTTTIEKDCNVLESFGIMDYSLLLAIHNVDEAKRIKVEKLTSRHSTATNATVEQSKHKFSEYAEPHTNPNSLVLSVHPRSKTKKGSVELDSSEESSPNPSTGIPAWNSNGDRLILFVGIIDILQYYRLRKKLEHLYKSILYDGSTVSVSNPTFYAKRFKSFICKEVFRKKHKRTSSIEQLLWD